jgi:GcrA cell cycle regulator
MGNHNATKAWDDERDAALRWGLSERMTFTEIAAFLNKRFGTAFTRSAIGGRAWRLGIKSLNPAKVRRGTKQERTAARERASQARRKPTDAPIRQRVAHMPQFHRDNLSGLRCAEIDPLNIALVDLAPHHCRWPVGGWPDAAPVTFCGQVKCSEHESYCHAHWQLSIGRGTASEQAAHRVQVA